MAENVQRHEQEETKMNDSDAAGSLRTVTPHLVCADAAAAIEFYKEAFGAVEMTRLAGPDGKLVHAMLRIGDAVIMLVDEFPEMHAIGPKALGGSPVTLHLSV